MKAKTTNAPVAPEQEQAKTASKPGQQPGERCEQCAGQGKVDDVEGRPWTRMDPIHQQRIGAGKATPKICPGGCLGTGIIQEKKITQTTQPLPPVT